MIAPAWLGSASARGTKWTSNIAVGTEAMAVTALIAPDSQYVPCQSVHTSMICVVPQASMNIPKLTNIQLKGRSRLLRMKYIRVTGMEK